MCSGALVSVYRPAVQPASWAVALLGLAWVPGAVHAAQPQASARGAGVQPSGSRMSAQLTPSAQASMADARPGLSLSAAGRAARSSRSFPASMIFSASQSGSS